MNNKNNYRSKLQSGHEYYDIIAWCRDHEVALEQLPFSIRLLLENNLRNYDDKFFTSEYLLRIGNWSKKYEAKEIPFLPSRILLQDLTGVPAVVDLAAMREAMQKAGGNPETIFPHIPVDLVIDHSVSMDYFGTRESLRQNMELEFQRNGERYRFLKWAENNLPNFHVYAPGQGICHQVNLEKIATVISEKDGLTFPDTLVGTDSHTTMINGLGVMGWGVGGIEAEAAMLGQPIYMLNPEVVGVELTGELGEGVFATDVVLHLTNLLRKVKVVGKFVEYFGTGAFRLSVTDRATIANMAPEYGATMGYFAVDEKTLEYLHLTGRDAHAIALVEEYTKANGLYRTEQDTPQYSQVVTLDLSAVRPSLAGPKRPQDLVLLSEVKSNFLEHFPAGKHKPGLNHGDLVLASITSCTNTSNPKVILGAALLAKKAVDLGLRVPDYVKTSFAPGSLAVTQYLKDAGLLRYLELLGFSVAGYGCATCIGNSGPLPEKIQQDIIDHDLQVAAILSGNRNFEGRIHPLIPANYLASPILVVAFALAGRIDIDLETEPISRDKDGRAIFWKHLCPSLAEIEEIEAKYVLPAAFQNRKREMAEVWERFSGEKSALFPWEENSTYVRLPNFFDGFFNAKSDAKTAEEICYLQGAKVLADLGDSVTTDHISPAGSIAIESPAAKYLQAHGIRISDFNSYGSRRGNHEVMMRGTFANIRLKNSMADGKIGGYTKKDGRILTIYDAAMEYQAEATPLMVFAGKEYGTGSSRDWAAKGPYLLGVKAVIAESFERIHRSNLLGMGILPIEISETEKAKLDPEMMYSIRLEKGWQPRSTVLISGQNGNERVEAIAKMRLDNEVEIEYFLNGGILNTVLRERL